MAPSIVIISGQLAPTLAPTGTGTLAPTHSNGTNGTSGANGANGANGTNGTIGSGASDGDHVPWMIIVAVTVSLGVVGALVYSIVQERKARAFWDPKA